MDNLTTHIIKTDDIHISRNNVNIISGISWKVTTKQHWAVIGSNGSGKTSLLRSIAGDLWPTTGSIWLFGKQLGFCDLPKLKKKIGWVGASIDKWLPPTETALNLVITGLYSTYELYRKPTKADIELAADTLNSLNCNHIIDRPFNKLSQGEKQKVRLARSLISKPDLLILDEVCSGLDISSREELIESIEAMTVSNLLYVTHHTEEIPSTISHCIILQKGKVLTQGTKHHTITNNNMSQAFGVNIDIEFDNRGRIWTKII